MAEDDGSALVLDLGEPAVGVLTGQPVVVRYVRDGDAVYRFKGEVRSVEGSLVRVRVTEDTERIQRREFVRVNIALDVVIEHRDGPITGSSVDLSAGGMALVCDRAFEVGDRFRIVTEVPGASGGFPLETRALVVHVYQAREGSYRYGLRFPDLPEGQRDRVAGAVNWLQVSRAAGGR